jgi:hypothetical protein
MKCVLGIVKPLALPTRDAGVVLLPAGELTADVSLSSWDGPFGVREHQLPSYLRTEAVFQLGPATYRYRGVLTRWDLWPKQGQRVSRTAPGIPCESEIIQDLMDCREDLTLVYDDGESYSFRVKYIGCWFKVLLTGQQICVWCRHYDPGIQTNREIFYEKLPEEVLFLKATKLSRDKQGQVEDWDPHGESFLDIERI